MAYSCQKQEEKPSTSNVLLLNAEGTTQTFQFCIKSGRKNKVEWDRSKTVFGALNENPVFRNSDKEGKEIIIRRSKGQSSEAAVKTDFPCCLIKKDETLKINFYKGEQIANQETTTDTDPESLVTFYIRTTGKTRKTIMKSSLYKENNIHYVCVFAHKGDTLKKALRHDGRFIDEIFEMDCKLVEGDDDWAINLKVDSTDGKTFELKLNAKCKKPQTSVRSDKNDDDSVHHSQQPKNTNQTTIQEKKTKDTDPSTEGHATQNTSGNSSGDSINSFFTDIRNILETILKDVLKSISKDVLKQQENSQFQEFMQKDYDKGVVECFTEVNKVKRIMELSDSVCLILVNNSPQGTGFLLFDRFILTNAHVVKDFVVKAPPTHKLSETLTALFHYEVVGQEATRLPVKPDLIAYGFEDDDRCRWHDFALLELDTVKPDCTELLSCYKHAPSLKHGGIYIVGHPDCGVKKMDPCFIIGIENQLQSINEHIKKNLSCPYVSWGCWPYLHQNRITYDSCFYHGSSGSPVFDEHCSLIGIHSGGFAYKEGEKTRSVIEYSYSLQPILESIITQVEKRSDILELLSKFRTKQEVNNLAKIENAYGANMPIKEEEQSEDKKMDEN